MLSSRNLNSNPCYHSYLITKICVISSFSPYSCIKMQTKYSLRSDLAITFEVPRAKKQAGDRAFSVAGPHLWNGLPSSVRTVDHMDSFKNKLKSHLFSWFFQALWAHCKRRYINHIIIIIIITQNLGERLVRAKITSDTDLEPWLTICLRGKLALKYTLTKCPRHWEICFNFLNDNWCYLMHAVYDLLHVQGTDLA